MTRLIFIFVLFCSSAAAQPSVWIQNQSNKAVMIDQDSERSRPIASITKLMTAMVALSSDADLDRKIVVRRGSKLPPGSYPRGEVLQAMLVKSDNAAAEILATDYPGGRSSFIAAMNTRARTLGMYNTSFTDPSGLSPNNVSTAKDIGKMVTVAATFPQITEYSVKKEIKIARERKRKIQQVTLVNTNRSLLYEFDEIKVSKTGFTFPAGYCLAMVVEKDSAKFAVVILGARDRLQRLAIAKHLIRTQLKSETPNPVPDLYWFNTAHSKF